MARDYLSYINHFLQEAGQKRRSYKDGHIGYKKDESGEISETTKLRYKKDVKDFTSFYTYYKGKNNKNKKAFEEAKIKRRHFKKAT